MISQDINVHFSVKINFVERQKSHPQNPEILLLVFKGFFFCSWQMTIGFFRLFLSLSLFLCPKRIIYRLFLCKPLPSSIFLTLEIALIFNHLGYFFFWLQKGIYISNNYNLSSSIWLPYVYFPILNKETTKIRPVNVWRRDRDDQEYDGGQSFQQSTKDVCNNGVNSQNTIIQHIKKVSIW